MKYIHVFLSILFFSSLQGQDRDTSLFTLYAEPFFYNVLRSEGGDFFAGTSDGIFQLEGHQLKKIDDRVGYVMFDKQGNLNIDPNGIKYHDQKIYLHLLPFSDKIRNEFHAGDEQHFYITDGGRLYVYRILPYVHAFKHQSVRAVSPNFVGTYSGIYYRGVRMGGRFPKFCDGHIRELNGKAFICYSTLLIVDIEGLDSIKTPLPPAPPGFDFDYISDILYSKVHQQYFMATNKALGTLNAGLDAGETLYSLTDPGQQVVLIGEDRYVIIFGAGNKLMAIDPKTRKTEVLGSLAEQIMGGSLSDLNYFLLTESGLHVMHADRKMEQLADLSNAHTLLKVGGVEYAIATDAGLFLYNATTRKLSTLIKGVEFNRYGLTVQDNRLYAGSINGLYVIDLGMLKSLALQNSKDQIAPPKTENFPLTISLLVALTLLLGVLYFTTRRKLKEVMASVQRSATPEFTRDDIEQFIRENLAQASLKSICERFQTTTTLIYTILDPEKPGAFINRLRMEQVQKMRADRRSAREIAEQTGFSESYVRKVWNNG